MKTTSLYIHYPFCLSKCHYCDFVSYPCLNKKIEDLTDFYLSELDSFYSYTNNRSISSIYFGGGTPSLMDTHLLDSILNKAHKLWHIDNNIEILENVTIQNIINSASIITIMLNPNEIYNTKTYNELEIIINNINQILFKIRKISNAKIYFLGFYNIYDNKEKDNKIIYTNSKIENLCKKYKIDYIDLYNVLKNRKYLFYINDNNLPNKDANIMISNEILKKYNQKSI